MLALAAAASADDPGLGLRRFGPDGGGRDTLTVGTGTVGPEGQVRVFVASELERAPFVLLPSGQIEGGAGGAAGASLDRWVAHVGFTGVVMRRLELSLRVPFAVADGASAERWGDRAPAARYDAPIALRARWAIAREGEESPVSLAASMELTPVVAGVIPPAQDGFTFASDERGVSPRLEAGRRFDRWLVGAQLGFTLRHALDYGTRSLRSELSMGAVVATRGAPLRVEGAVLAAFNFDGFQNGAEVLGGVRWSRRRLELFALGGPGFGASPAIPRFRVLAGIAWQTDTVVTPRDEDADRRARVRQNVAAAPAPGAVSSPGAAAPPEAGGTP